MKMELVYQGEEEFIKHGQHACSPEVEEAEA